jgi:stage V sporulation protein SpoVS
MPTSFKILSDSAPLSVAGTFSAVLAELKIAYGLSDPSSVKHTAPYL